jgi:hypothetical protein
MANELPHPSFGLIKEISACALLEEMNPYNWVFSLTETFDYVLGHESIVYHRCSGTGGARHVASL